MNHHCPLEAKVAEALDAAGIPYERNKLNLDFYLPNENIYIEVKGGHSKRITDQMARDPNVIAVQGVKSVKFLVDLLKLIAP